MKIRRKPPLHCGGQEKCLPAYYEGQDTSGKPNHYVPRGEAEQMKNCGDARPINSGRAILILKSQSPKPASTDRRAFNGWRVTGQTARPDVFHRFTSVYPGFPQMELV